jgi:hypothetical protein
MPTSAPASSSRSARRASSGRRKITTDHTSGSIIRLSQFTASMS